MSDLANCARTLLDLHTAPEVLVLANVWDVVSATDRGGSPPGVRALATASHSIAATFGYDGRRADPPRAAPRHGAADRRRPPTCPVTHGLRGGVRRRGRHRAPRHRGRRGRRQPRGPAEAARRGRRRGRGGAWPPVARPASTSCSTRGPTSVARAGDAPRTQVLDEAIRRGPGVPRRRGARSSSSRASLARDEIRTVAEALGPQRLTVISVPGRLAARPTSCRSSASPGSRRARSPSASP